MKEREVRNYDRSKVTNIFAVGEQIEWMEGLTETQPGSKDNVFLTIYQTGIIKEITGWTVILEINGQDKELKKLYLENRVADAALAKAIAASFDNKRPNKAKLPPEEKHKSGPAQDVYRLRDPRDKAVFYIGMSKNSQGRFKQHLACVGLNFKLNIRIQEILQSGLLPEMELIEQGINGAKKARERERYWISFHTQSGDILTNIAEMGE